MLSWLLPSGLTGLTPSTAAPAPNSIEFRILFMPLLGYGSSKLFSAMLCGLPPSPSNPVLLRTLVVRFGPLLDADATSASAFFLRRQNKKAARAIAARPINVPMTIPAVAPPERPFRCICSDSAAPPPTTVGVEVVVCVMAAPEAVVTLSEVTWFAECVDWSPGV